MRIEQHTSNAVEELAVSRVRCLTRCAACGEVDDTGEDITAAYKLGNWISSNNDPLVELFKGERKKMTDALETSPSENADECTCCRWLAEQLRREGDEQPLVGLPRKPQRQLLPDA